MGILTEKQGQADDKCLGVGAADKQLQLVYPVVVHNSQVTPEEAECIHRLRLRIQEDEDILHSGVEQDDDFLLAFVLGAKCNVEKAYGKIKNYVYVRKVKYPKFFRKLSPRNFAYLIDGSSGPRFAGKLKHYDHLGRAVGIARCSAFEPRIHKGDDVIQGFVAAGQEIIWEKNAPRNGIVLIVDAAGFGFRHAREITLSRIYMFLQIFLNSYPIRYKAFHILNNAYLFDTILALVKQLLPRKLRERIHLHGSNWASLHEHVPKEILPETLGGILSDEDAYDTDLEQSLLSKKEYYEKMATNW